MGFPGRQAEAAPDATLARSSSEHSPQLRQTGRAEATLDSHTARPRSGERRVQWARVIHVGWLTIPAGVLPRVAGGSRPGWDLPAARVCDNVAVVDIPQSAAHFRHPPRRQWLAVLVPSLVMLSLAFGCRGRRGRRSSSGGSLRLARLDVHGFLLRSRGRLLADAGSSDLLLSCFLSSFDFGGVVGRGWCSWSWFRLWAGVCWGGGEPG